MKKKLPLVVGLAVLLLLLATWWAAHRSQSLALRAELDALRAQIAAAPQPAAINPAATSPISAQSLERLRADASEVHKLRNEINQLRANAKELDKLKAENQQLRRGGGVSPAANAGPGQNAATPGNFIPKENWSFSGYANPENTLQSIAWAMREGDLQTVLSSVTPEEQTRMKGEWGNKSDTEISANVRQGVEKVQSIQVLESKNVSADEVVLTIYAVGGEDHVQRIVMQRSGSDWKLAGPKRE
jgi:TolA-binding protein